MRVRILKAVVLLLIFIGSNLFFVHIMNSQSTESASDLTDPTLPVVYVTVGGENVNAMQGYTQEMDGRKMRECIIPLTTDREITISYKAFGNTVESVSYEVTAPDSGERVENAKIGSFRDNGDSRTATFTLSRPILMDREYPICFTLQTGGREVYYYARVLQRADLTIGPYIQFVNSFYQTCMNKQASTELKSYIQPDDTVINNSFSAVDNYSSLDLVTWGNLKPQLFRKAMPTIREINGTTCTVTCDYLISASGEDGLEIYHVYEYYRLRWYRSEIALLNFERQALQVFDLDNSPLTTSGIDLGVSTRDVQFKTDTTSDIVAFVQDRALWTFRGKAEKLSQVFTLQSVADGSDERSDNKNYGIRIIRVSDSGDVDFAVYGYMNRGKHEGQCGVSVCRYSGERVNVEELAFIPFDGSFELLEKYVEKLSYINGRGHYFLYLDDTLYRFDTTEGTCRAVLENIDPDCFVSARSGKYAAWVEEMDPDSGRHITMIDFDTERTRRIAAGADEYLRVIGFINDDLIYGTANGSDLRQMPAGDILFPMKNLIISSFDESELKEYAPEGLWIRDVVVEEGLLSIDRVRYENGEYVEAASDDIMNNKRSDTTRVKTDTFITNRRGTTVALVTAGANTNLNPLVSTAKIRNVRRDVTILPKGRGERAAVYYVYARGGLDSVFSKPARAVVRADSLKGVVIDTEGRYIYERGSWPQREELTNDEIPDVMKAGILDAEAVSEQLPGCIVLNLSGCTLEEMLYYIGRGYPVIGLRKDGSEAVLVGYDIFNTIMYNRQTGDHYYEAYEDSTPAFEDGGSVFVTFIEDKKTIRE